MNRRVLEILPDHRLDMRIARQQRAVAVVHRDRGVVCPSATRCEEFFESWPALIARVTTPRNSPFGPVTLWAMTVAQPPVKRPCTSSIRTGVAAAPDLKALKKADRRC